MAEGVGHYRDVAAVGAVGGAGVEGGIAVDDGVFDFVDLYELLISVALIENFPDVVGCCAFR